MIKQKKKIDPFWVLMVFFVLSLGFNGWQYRENVRLSMFLEVKSLVSQTLRESLLKEQTIRMLAEKTLGKKLAELIICQQNNERLSTSVDTLLSENSELREKLAQGEKRYLELKAQAEALQREGEAFERRIDQLEQRIKEFQQQPKPQLLPPPRRKVPPPAGPALAHR